MSHRSSFECWPGIAHGVPFQARLRIRAKARVSALVAVWHVHFRDEACQRGEVSFARCRVLARAAPAVDSYPA
eukprot:10119850-Alexandrium_andersonii.AAC.1